MSGPDLTPPLCERCWFPIEGHEPVRQRTTPDDEVVLIGFEHAGQLCTPQQPEMHAAPPGSP
ncbi:hypothetical protein [Actinomycetospora sp. TBRC 11914]|uniref:hypothetical protein n=1 Tax=Actinomycetospora sp. TBRC 11914 TaxID=2729387 RepID=UPI00145C4F0F|nr:hypothetical protein [Actinomycetospora sp. TBRC 11914]NMO89463.1 hypothetical protein [Actinomycetospora sp. TBRC 11914]